MAFFGLFKKTPTGDPNPGEGGYEHGRGPAGETGYPGSTSQVRTDPPEAGGKLHDDYGGNGVGYGANPNAAQRSAVTGDATPGPLLPPRNRRGVDRAWVPPPGQQEDKQEEPSEWFGGPNRHIGTSELGPNKGLGSVDDTAVQRTLGYGSPGLGGGVPGDQGVHKNSKFYKGQQAAPDGDNRYVFGGRNGGQTSYTFDRRMPYTGHSGDVPQNVGGRFSVRGGVLSGDRLYLDISEEYFGDQNGQFGYQRETPDGRHRPTEYYEPGPWTANFYDTTAEAGSPAEAGKQSQAFQAVSYSPNVPGRRRA